MPCLWLCLWEIQNKPTRKSEVFPCILRMINTGERSEPPEFITSGSKVPETTGPVPWDGGGDEGVLWVGDPRLRAFTHSQQFARTEVDGGSPEVAEVGET